MLIKETKLKDWVILPDGRHGWISFEYQNGNREVMTADGYVIKHAGTMIVKEKSQHED